MNSLLLLTLLGISMAQIITKSMIRGPDLWYEPVLLKSKEEIYGNEENEQFTVTPEPPPPTTELPITTVPTTTETARQISETPRRTRLFPIEGQPFEKAANNIWSLFTEAINCVWSGVGMDCLKYKVVPMFKSFMGFHQHEPPLLYLPRTIEENDSESDGRRRRHHHGLKLIKGLFLGLFGFKTIILPILVGLALISGKAVFVSLLSLILTVAAAWSNMKQADRRVQNESAGNYFM